MNKYIDQSDVSTTNTHNGSNNQPGNVNPDNRNKENDLAWNYALIDVEKLGGFVTTTARKSYYTLGAGLPVCVYQLKLFNDLTKQGLKLKSGKSLLNRCTKTDTIRDFVIVNDAIVVEYISSEDMSDHYEKIIQSDLYDNNYAMGFLVKVSGGNNSEKESIEIIKIDRDYLAH